MYLCRSVILGLAQYNKVLYKKTYICCGFQTVRYDTAIGGSRVGGNPAIPPFGYRLWIRPIAQCDQHYFETHLPKCGAVVSRIHSVTKGHRFESTSRHCIVTLDPLLSVRRAKRATISLISSMGDVKASGPNLVSKSLKIHARRHGCTQGRFRVKTPQN